MTFKRTEACALTDQIVVQLAPVSDLGEASQKVCTGEKGLAKTQIVKLTNKGCSAIAIASASTLLPCSSDTPALSIFCVKAGEKQAIGSPVWQASRSVQHGLISSPAASPSF